RERVPCQAWSSSDLNKGGGALSGSAPPRVQWWCSGGDVLLRVGAEHGAAPGAAQPVAGALVVAEQTRGLGDALDDGPALHHRAHGHVILRGAHEVRTPLGLHRSVGSMAAAAAGGLIGGVVHGFPSIGMFVRGGSVLRD